jgi:hypothetical protein
VPVATRMLGLPLLGYLVAVVRWWISGLYE